MSTENQSGSQTDDVIALDEFVKYVGEPWGVSVTPEKWEWYTVEYPTVYISGPMSGMPDHNFPAFNEAAKRWRDTGAWVVVNPAEFEVKEENEWHHYLRRDIKALMDCDYIAVLPGWRESKGASLEVYIAQKLGMKVLDAETFKELQESPNQEAFRLVHGDRGANYGHPYDDFSKTAAIWSVILGQEVRPEQVPLCMIGVKISREINKPQRDNRVDIAGYIETLEMVREIIGDE